VKAIGNYPTQDRKTPYTCMLQLDNHCSYWYWYSNT